MYVINTGQEKVDDVLLRTIKGSFKYNYETSDSVKGRTFLAGVPISLPRKSVQMKWLKNLKNN